MLKSISEKEHPCYAPIHKASSHFSSLSMMLVAGFLFAFIDALRQFPSIAGLLKVSIMREVTSCQMISLYLL